MRRIGERRRSSKRHSARHNCRSSRGLCASSTRGGRRRGKGCEEDHRGAAVPTCREWCRCVSRSRALCAVLGRPLRRLGVVPLLRLIATTAYLKGRFDRCLLVVFALWAARSTRAAAQQATHHDQDACATDKKAAAKGREDHRRKLKRVRERLKHCLHAACSVSRAGRGDVWRNRRQHSWRRVDAHRGRKRRSIIVCHPHNIFGWRRRRWWRWRWRHSREEYCRGRLKDDSWRW